jgi:protein SCO1/2
MRATSLPVIALALLLAGCGGASDRRQYTLQGQVLSISADRREASIKHEEIAGLMPAMTMSYKGSDAAQFEPLAPGDLITATLVIVSNDAYLQDVRKVGEAPLERPPAAPSASSGFELLTPGEAVPNTQFVDQDGRTRDMASFRNQTLVVTFIYTRCPIPTFCPLMDRHFATLQKVLASEPALQNVHLVSVSFDPIADTPPVLKKHAATLGADPKRWTFLTGQRDDIDQFAARFGVAVTREQNDPLDIAHNLRTAIVDAQGAFVKAYPGNEWTPDQILADLRRVAATD